MALNEPIVLVKAEDGVVLRNGSRAYCHLTMRPGTVTKVRTAHDGFEGWFTFVYDDGTDEMLNGERVVTVNYARQRGWPNAS